MWRIQSIYPQFPHYMIFQSSKECFHFKTIIYFSPCVISTYHHKTFSIPTLTFLSFFSQFIIHFNPLFNTKYVINICYYEITQIFTVPFSCSTIILYHLRFPFNFFILTKWNMYIKSTVDIHFDCLLSCGPFKINTNSDISCANITFNLPN